MFVEIFSRQVSINFEFFKITQHETFVQLNPYKSFTYRITPRMVVFHDNVCEEYFFQPIFTYLLVLFYIQ